MIQYSCQVLVRIHSWNTLWIFFSLYTFLWLITFIKKKVFNVLFYNWNSRQRERIKEDDRCVIFRDECIDYSRDHDRFPRSSAGRSLFQPVQPQPSEWQLSWAPFLFNRFKLGLARTHNVGVLFSIPIRALDLDVVIYLIPARDRCLQVSKFYGL